jgi:hypothetical protein
MQRSNTPHFGIMIVQYRRGGVEENLNNDGAVHASWLDVLENGIHDVERNQLPIIRMLQSHQDSTQTTLHYNLKWRARQQKQKNMYTVHYVAAAARTCKG